MPAIAPPPDHRHHIRESLTTRAAKFICSIFLTLLLITAVIIFILWLSLRPHRPRFHLFSFSTHNIASGALQTISFNVSSRNPNREIGIYYDAISASVFYNNDAIGSSPVLFPFYQPPKNTTAVRGEIGVEELSVGAAAEGQMAGGRVGFRLELASTIRFRVSRWDSHRHGMHVACYVEVGGDGEMLAEYVGRKCPIYFG
ncbi:protein NDR1-like [Phalaenopsis equestris]|uniref:protein NDR1-like n=1 Tax=Phalaenopsis equestris TaxID=78828 RepID=UPI0009E356E4|nr:protein NDR1-like [Phalaenopsis equestris]